MSLWSILFEFYANMVYMALIENKKAFFNYEILETYEAGVELFGYEVKSIRKSMGSLDGSHVSIKGNEVFLVGMLVSPYQEKNTPEEYNPRRERKLLLKKNEVEKMIKDLGGKGLTIVPIKLYSKNSKIKVEIALVRGKKKYDKRETIKKRDIERELGRTLKR